MHDLADRQQTLTSSRSVSLEGSVVLLGPILFAVYASPVADVIASHGVQYQYADDTQLRSPCDARRCRQHFRYRLSVQPHHPARRLLYCRRQRPAAQSGQIKSTDRRNGTPARYAPRHQPCRVARHTCVANVDLPLANERKVLT